MRLTIAAFAFLLFPAVGHANDPTFNGLFQGVQCNFNQMILCEGDFCRPAHQSQQDLMEETRNPIQVDFKELTMVRGYSRNVPPVPIEIEGVSEARLGQILWVRFNAESGGRSYKAQTTYYPTGSTGGCQMMGAMLRRSGRTTP